MQEAGPSGTSFLNRTEASVCEKILTRFLQAGGRADQIGVITPYDGQKAYLLSHLARGGGAAAGSLSPEAYKSIEVGRIFNLAGWVVAGGWF